jgi:hypothetical protein
MFGDLESPMALAESSGAFPAIRFVAIPRGEKSRAKVRRRQIVINAASLARTSPAVAAGMEAPARRTGRASASGSLIPRCARGPHPDPSHRRRDRARARPGDFPANIESMVSSAGSFRMTTSFFEAAISTRSPSLRSAAWATSAGKRISRFFPQRPMTARGMGRLLGIPPHILPQCREVPAKTRGDAKGGRKPLRLLRANAMLR